MALRKALMPRHRCGWHDGQSCGVVGLLTVDGITAANGDRVLVKDQTTQSANGVYVAASGAWARALDADAWTELPSAYVFVETGTVNADSGWLCTVDAGGTIGSTAITWVQFSGAGQIAAGAGLTKTGSTIDVIGTAGRILVNADNIDIDSGYVGQASITTLGTVATGTRCYHHRGQQGWHGRGDVDRLCQGQRCFGVYCFGLDPEHRHFRAARCRRRMLMRWRLLVVPLMASL